MSGSPPPCRSPNSPPTNITRTPDSTTSRTYRPTETTSNTSSIEEHRQESETPVASNPTAPHPSSSHQTPQSSVKRPSSADLQEESSTMALTKRQRVLSPSPKQEESQERMSPSSDSPDPENEHSDAKGKEVKQHLPDNPPVKKKRTRTLTTPHQAAVLHALLAQSRFPTTAMREEVGRSIGLSARKVQIWFQNQRQKARRPRKEPDESAPLPPRYGPFPAYPPQAHSSSFPVMPGPSPPPNPQLLPTTYNAPVQQPYGRQAYPPEPSSSNQSVESPDRLLGPGVPGADLYGSSYHGQSRGPREIGPSQDTTTPSGTPYSSGSSSQLYSPRFGLQPPILRPAATAGTTYDQSFNRTLPPLSFDSARPSSGGSHVSGGPLPHPSFITLPPPEPSRPRRRSSVSPQVPHFVPQTPDVHGHSRVVLPPPFTLQPEPRWDDSAFSANLRPSFTRSRTGSQTTRGSSASPISRTRETSGLRKDSVAGDRSTLESTQAEATTSGAASTPSIRGGRYDPVRATFIPYTTKIPSPTHSPLSQRDPRNDADDADSSREP